MYVVSARICESGECAYYALVYLSECEGISIRHMYVYMYVCPNTCAFSKSPGGCLLLIYYIYRLFNFNQIHYSDLCCPSSLDLFIFVGSPILSIFLSIFFVCRPVCLPRLKPNCAILSCVFYNTLPHTTTRYTHIQLIHTIKHDRRHISHLPPSIRAMILISFFHSTHDYI